MFNIEYDNGKILNLNNLNDLSINNIKSIYIIYNKKKYGINRYGNFLIDNFKFDLKQKVENYKMNIIGGKTVKHDIILNNNLIFGYYIGYELIGSNEYYKYIMRINKNGIFIEANKRINNIDEYKIINF